MTLHGFIHTIFWHRIDIKKAFEIRSKENGRVIKKWKESRSQKAYTPQEAGGEPVHLNGEDHWMSFKYQLDQFVNKVTGRETRYWVSREDSILQMKMVDMAYGKSGLGVRPTSEFKVG